MSFDQALAVTERLEGGYSNNPADRGGPTKFGITEKTARANGYAGDMQDLDILTARRIYRIQYWDINRLDEVDRIDPTLAAKLFDAGVNCGTANAARWLQRALNVLNRQGTLYEDIRVDGQIGPATIYAMSRLYATRKLANVALWRYVNSQQGVYYMECAENRQANEEFVLGWALQRLAGA